VVPIFQPEILGTIDDGPVAMAPQLDAADIAESISFARAGWVALSELAVEEAPAVAIEWSWDNQLKPLLEQLRG
jgi:hypothetical protein